MNTKNRNYRLPSIRAVLTSLTAIMLVCFPAHLSAEEKAPDKKLTVLITGANRGLGLEYAKRFIKDGHTVIGTTRSPEEAVDLKEAGAEVLKLDVTIDEDIANLAKSLKGRPLDILVNNAGYLGRKSTREDMNLSFSVNTLGPLYVSEALVPSLSLSAQPKIINISSRAGRLADGTGKMTSYAVSKTALNMVTRTLHSRLNKKGFIVISLAPGRNQTEMGGKGAPLKPEETADKIIPLIESLTTKHSGGFWYYDGSELSW